MTNGRLLSLVAGALALATVGIALRGAYAVAGGVRPAPSANADWSAFEGGPESRHHSPLTQIDRENVRELAVAWTYPAGERATTSNPIVIDGVVYLLANAVDVVALDGASGREIWRRNDVAGFRNRGLALWRSRDGRESRLFFNKDNRLVALDATTGQDVESFGVGGSIDLRQGFGRPVDSIPQIASGMPGRIFENLIILGSSTGEEYDSPPGDIRAYDVQSGRNVWTFHTIPHPGEVGHDSWPAGAWKTNGGADNWGGMSLDPVRGIVYVVTASAKYNFWGGNRKGQNLFANSVIALDARSGRRLWHFQAVHHDVWDYDLTASPVLMTVRHEGRARDIVAVAGKTGFLYVFDRVTGEPLWPIEERPVPKSDVPGEETWPTQPYPTKPAPFSRQSFSLDDLDPHLPADERAELTARIQAARTGPIFTPPSTQESVMMPGHRGGANWGMTAGEPHNGRMYVASFDFPVLTKLVYGLKMEVLLGATPFEGGKTWYEFACQGCHGTDRSGNPPSVPSLVGITERRSAAEILAAVQQGRPPMPAFPFIAGQAATDLITFLSGDPDHKVELPKGAASAAPPDDRWRSDYGFWFTRAGNPVTRPPWSQLTAYDLNTGDIRWQRPIGEDPEYNRRGIFGTGQILVQPGIALTATGLIFAATHRDRTLWIIDADDGRTLHRIELPAPPLGIPSIYGAGGRQFVLVPATGSGSVLLRGQARPTAGANTYVAYALPVSQGSGGDTEQRESKQR